MLVEQKRNRDIICILFDKKKKGKMSFLKTVTCHLCKITEFPCFLFYLEL